MTDLLTFDLRLQTSIKLNYYINYNPPINICILYTY